MSEKYRQLDNAVKDLLSELRIDENCLNIMAKGKSPDYPGVVFKGGWENPHCKVQLSAVVAQKLIDAMEVYKPETTDTAQEVS